MTHRSAEDGRRIYPVYVRDGSRAVSIWHRNQILGIGSWNRTPPSAVCEPKFDISSRLHQDNNLITTIKHAMDLFEADFQKASHMLTSTTTTSDVA